MPGYLADQRGVLFLQLGPHFLNVCSGRKITVVTNLGFFVLWKIPTTWDASKDQSKEQRAPEELVNLT